MTCEHGENTLGPLDGAEGKAETARRLCRILYRVHEKRIGFAEGPCDCACPDRKSDPKNFRSTGEALLWLEKLVEAMPSAKVAVRVTESWTVDEYGRVTFEPAIIRPAAPSGSAPTATNAGSKADR